MPAHKVPLAIEQGATFDQTYTWKSGSKNAAHPVDLTGCKARAQVRAEISSQEILLELTTENQGIVLGGVAGTIRIHITASASAAFDWESGVYDLEVEFPDGTVVRRMAGGVSVSPEVTRG